MLIPSQCPECHLEMEVSRNLVGKPIKCKRCDATFEVAAPKQESNQTYAMESFFQSEDHSADTAAPVHRKAVALASEYGPQSLELPQPPREHWSASRGEEEAVQVFGEFRQDSRAVRNFLERDLGSDYSWLLVLGLIWMMVLLAAFMSLMCLVIFIRL